MKLRIFEKSLVIFSIALILNLFIQPSIAQNLSEQKKEFVEAEITEYDQNGLAEKKIIKLPLKMVNEIKNKLMKNRDGRLSILEEYGLIKNDTNLGEEKITNPMSIFNVPILLDSFCKINAIYVINGDTHIGFPIAGLKKFFGSKILSFDLVDMCWGAIGVVETTGLLRSHTLITIPSFMLLGGFVGVHIHIPMILDIYHGFSTIAFSVGFGIHSTNFNVVSFTVLGLIIGIILMGMIGSSSS